MNGLDGSEEILAQTLTNLLGFSSLSGAMNGVATMFVKCCMCHHNCSMAEPSKASRPRQWLYHIDEHDVRYDMPLCYLCWAAEWRYTRREAEARQWKNPRQLASFRKMMYESYEKDVIKAIQVKNRWGSSVELKFWDSWSAD